MWRFPIDIKLDITTRCNAGCPQCHRTNLTGLKAHEWLPDIVWSLDQFKRAFPEKVAKHILHWNICGTWGDPLTNNDLLDIARYIRQVNPEAHISINTNGSLRNEDWWWEFGIVGGKNLHVVFAVEGTTQKMHERYRQFTFLDKILKNMEMLSNTPARARIRVDTLVWKHNENHLDEIEKLVMDHGATKHNRILTDRWEGRDEMSFFTGKETATLGKASVDFSKEEKTYNKREADCFTDDEGTEKKFGDFIKQTTKLTVLDSKMVKKIRKEKKIIDITCKWQKANKLEIESSGQVLPCCYFSNPYFLDKNSPSKKNSFMEHPIMIEYEKYKKELNIFTANLLDIVNHKWYTETLPNSWNAVNPVWSCQKHCGKCK